MSILAKIFLGLIWLYQRSFSTIMGMQCRYYPTCSAYTAGSIRRFGALKGSALGAWRICRCNPWSRGGHDPVPERFILGNILSKNARRCDKSCGDSQEEEQQCST
jgi:putative membrane protein insertion efficiency factor